MGNPNWRSPEWLIEASREVLGGIDIDPCSDAEAQKTVKAHLYFTKDQSIDLTDLGLCLLGKSWYINPPGNLVRRFWKDLNTARWRNCFRHAIWVGFNIGQLRSLQDPSPLVYPICVPRKRIAFIDPEDKARRSPMYDNFIAYLPGSINKTERFLGVFEEFGEVKR